ncbi:V-set and immunoglobulin domain-containing protein 4-like isoform X2 [Pezoporus flaviventris]|uniref:V-set and immunoglobulin domain-containing protein 4-like isoform X2 n=1 Tax=Pezoporus flaviventris TaxID=889875 RepID=UPI002AAF16BF|nr:V-set and immunoglobulin domain-containing protein 4-like isoform X2 [Pezoporus flaviventris]
METLVRAAVVLSPFLFCNAFLNLTGQPEIEGVWKDSTTLPCVYVPVKDLVQEILKWMVVRDQNSVTIFRRDDSGDHVLLSDYRGRVSVLNDAPGNVSLHILNLEVSDKGTYICQVTWRDSSDSLIVREITTELEIVKVAATKPIIRAGELGLTVPAGARTSLTCVASGSPPIRYRWFRGTPGRKALLLSGQAELVWDSLQPSDTGKYYCEVENRAGAGAVQQSDAVELTVTEPPVTVVTSENGVGYPEKNYTTQTQTYEVKFHNSRAAAASRCESAGYYEEPISTENKYAMEPVKDKRSEEINMKKNEHDCVGNTMESEYEVGDTA